MAPTQRFDKLDPDRREQLLDTAAREFADNGYESASLQRVIEKAGISKGSLYYYFENKADLFTSVLSKLTRALMAKYAFDIKTLTAEDYWQRIEDTVHSLVRVIFEQPLVLGVLRAWYSLPPSARGEPLVASMYGSMRGWIGELVVHGQRLGVVRTDLPASLLVEVLLAAGEAIDRWGLAHMDQLSTDDMSDVTNKTMDMFRRMAMPLEVKR